MKIFSFISDSDKKMFLTEISKYSIRCVSLKERDQIIDTLVHIGGNPEDFNVKVLGGNSAQNSPETLRVYKTNILDVEHVANVIKQSV